MTASFTPTALCPLASPASTSSVTLPQTDRVRASAVRHECCRLCCCTAEIPLFG
ncbi:hypothetical protein ACWCPT_18680 [Streptomyces sp. NPDC002308]